jgi:hypothetical protein
VITGPSKSGEPPPSNSESTLNAAWYRLSLFTYNVLSALTSPDPAARPKRLRFTVFTLAGRLLAPAGRLVLRLSAAAERLAGLIAARAGTSAGPLPLAPRL